MPRFCANLKWLFTELPLLERFDAAARAGFEAVEYPTPYEQPAPVLRARLKDCGLQQILINTPAGDAAKGEQSGIACLPGRQAAFRDDWRRALHYADALECNLVHLQAGILPQDIPRELAHAVYVGNVFWAVEQAAAAGKRVVLEPINQRDIPRFFLRTQEEGAAIIEAVGRDRIGLQFDLYHCQVEQGDLTRRMEALMPVIDHMQIADNPGRHEPGTGEIAWDYVFRRIDELGYQGWVGCEYKPRGGTAEGLSWRARYGV
jgi:hydroxypyruvate isomerase